jgi:hypothetical protein
LTPLSAYLTAAIPDTTASLLAMFLLMAASRGARSAATKLAANDLVSIPDPAPMVFVMFAVALLFAAVVAVLVPVVLLEEVDVTAVTMVYFSLNRSTHWVSLTKHSIRCT